MLAYIHFQVHYCSMSYRSVCLSIASLQLMTDTVGNPEEERRSEFYEEPWAQEAVGRYVFSKVGNKE